MGTPCMMKESVQDIVSRARRALATAEGGRADALHRLVATCTSTLAKARRWPNYPDGRLDTGDATVAFNAAEAFELKYPGVLGD